MFNLVGGDAALDFVNTVSDWTREDPREDLPTFADAMRFAVQAGLLSRTEARGLDSDIELARLHELRALLYRLFTNTRQDDLDRLSRAYADATRHGRLHQQRGSVDYRFDLATSGGALLRHRVVARAVALLTDDARLQRLKSCPNCAWVFLDVSKNGSRRWCSMDMCGGSAKARTYYQRKKTRS